MWRIYILSMKDVINKKKWLFCTVLFKKWQIHKKLLLICADLNVPIRDILHERGKDISSKIDKYRLIELWKIIRDKYFSKVTRYP